MKAKIYIKEGNTLTLDEYATEQFLKATHDGKLISTLQVFHVNALNNKFVYSVPLCNVLYVEYVEGE